MSDVDVPDLDLFPQHYPELSTVRFSAGLEVGAVPPRAVGGVVAGARRHRAQSWPACRADAGHEAAAVGVSAAIPAACSCASLAANGAGRPAAARTWHLVARSGDGPYVPAMASVILAKRIAAGSGPPAGAMPCFGLFTLGEFEAEISDLDITCWLDGTEATRREP